jgi:enamine deaminase RidA (YjgF/YER057c/UK114 family)
MTRTAAPSSGIIGAGEAAGEREMGIEQRLKELGVTLPQVGGPLGNYVHAKRVGSLLYLSGKGPPDGPDGKMPKGKLGAGMSIDEAYRHARGVGLVLIAAIKDALGGDLDRVEDVVRVLGMVNAAPDFEDRRSSMAARTCSSRCSASAGGMRAPLSA